MSLNDIFRTDTNFIPKLKHEFSDCNIKYKFTDILKTEKTLTTNEAMVMWGMIKRFKPQRFLEVGVRYGCSSYMIGCCLKYYKLPQHTGIDINKELKHGKGMYKFVHANVLDKLPGIIKDMQMVFMDAHPKSVIEPTIKAGLEHNPNIIWLFHDVGKKVFKKETYTILDTCEDDWGKHQCFERHYMAKYFGGEKLLDEDHVETDDYICHIEDDKWGLGIAVPKSLFKKKVPKPPAPTVPVEPTPIEPIAPTEAEPITLEPTPE